MTRTIEELRQLQALPLAVKIEKSKQRIREWVDHFGEDGVYVSFSGGKDSTVLLHIVREMYPDVPAVFCDTGLEYPEIREFVKAFDNVVWLKPKMTFRQVIEEYGYPFIGKEVSQAVWEVRHYGKDRSKRTYSKFLPDSEHNIKYNGRYSMARYAWLLDDEAPMITHKCCNIMKKDITKQYTKETGRVAITGMMADESTLRTAEWLKHGCNAFDTKKKSSKPLSFWTGEDVLRYLKWKELPICSVYGEIVEEEQLTGQMRWDEYAGFEIDGKKLKTTGLQRTGCMFCGYGCHLEKGESRFEKMKQTHPKQYEYIMKPWDKGGLGYKEVIDWLNEHGNINIRY